MTQPLSPYEVPEQDHDLLGVGSVRTEERLQASGLIQCAECGEYRPPKFKHYCSRACEQQHGQHLLEQAAREAPHQPCGLSAVETLQLMFTLNNRLRAAGYGGMYVSIEPWNGFSTTLYDKLYVGATKAVIVPNLDVPTEALQSYIDALLPYTTVPFESRPALRRNPITPGVTSEEVVELVYDMHVNRRLTFKEIGRSLNRSDQWAGPIYHKAFRIAYPRALRLVRPVPVAKSGAPDVGRDPK